MKRNGGSGKLHLSPGDLRVESFDVAAGDAHPGTVRGHDQSGPCPSQDPGYVSCVYGSCVPTACGSCGEATCDDTCGPPNYGCDSVDPRCTHGGVYPC
ncbi:MAG TPA: hypothetical protein VFQ39_09905 [Longimicrobium sp.]|nr:hypothetical protein [Longimicrobium sp.]